MKILQVPVRFYPYIGGVENHVLNISRILVNRGHEVLVICANEPKTRITDIDGINVERLGYICKIANTNITLKLPIRLFKEEFDIIHAHIPTPWSADWSSIIAKLKSKPLILTYYNDIVGNGLFDIVAKAYNLTTLKLVLQRAHRIIVLQRNYINYSPHLKRYKDKIEVIPAGVDTKKFRPADEEKKGNSIFFLGILDEFHRYKGLDYLLKSLKIIKEKVKDLKLVVGGKGKLLSFYKKMAKDLGVYEDIEFVGFIPDESLVSYYNKGDVFVLPSISNQEGFGMVLLEALACGLPVVTTEIVGIAKEIKENSIGKVVKQKDERELAYAIIEILQNEDLRMKMGNNGRKIIEEKYSWEAVVDQLEKIYEACP